MDFLFPFLNRNSKLSPPSAFPIVTPLPAEWNFCDPYLGAITRTGVNPKSIGGARTSPGVPEPRSRKRWKRALTIPLRSKVSVSASAWEDYSGDGNIVIERQPGSAPTRSTPRIPGRLRTGGRVVFGVDQGGWEHEEELLTSLDDAGYSKDSLGLFSGKKAVLRKALGPAIHSSDLDWSKKQKRFRAELKREAMKHTLSFVTDDNKFGRFTMVVNPKRKISVSMIVKQAFFEDIFTSRSTKMEWERKKFQLEKKIALMNRMKVDVQRAVQEHGVDGKNHDDKTVSLEGRQDQIRKREAQLMQRLNKLLRNNPRKPKKGIGSVSDVTVKSDIEYRWKENTFAMNGALEMLSGVLALNARTNPMRFTPSIQVPLGKKGNNSPWLTWTHAPESGIGEIQIGRKGVVMSANFASEKLSIRRKQSNGNSSRVTVSKHGAASIDKSIVSKPVFGNSMANVNLHAQHPNRALGLNATLVTPFGAVSAAANTARSFNVTADFFVETGRRAYTAGLKLDSNLSVAGRVGLYF